MLVCSTSLESLAWQRQHAPKRETVKHDAPPLPIGKDFHVFFSCHSNAADSNWVKVVTRELEQKGYKCCTFHKDYDVGKSFSDNLKMVLEKSMRVVCVLSSAYIKEEWSQLEMEIISNGEMNKIVFIPVLIEPCDIPPFLKYYKYINALNSKESWWNNFLYEVRRDVPTMKSKKKYHVFFAHARADTKWVADVVSHLETPQEGLACCYPGRDFRTGISMKDIENAMKRSLTTVLVLSPSFLSFEWKKYYEGRLRSNRTLPVIVSDSVANLPISLDDMICIDARCSGDWLSVLSQAIKQHGELKSDFQITM
ncbi:hypothetical protein FSP39_009892 [Pinctada imbricata]|uniref:TIR domain-containing protein n=1 Tax=Pinctada imbricata TaxID=66713 RepID=A0AA88Y5R3_PINIB|nr:hypothetical protein FSP39_009892 [Pinctada imbricata]